MGFEGLLALLNSSPAVEERQRFGLNKEKQLSSLQGMGSDVVDRKSSVVEIAKTLAAEAADQGRDGMIAVANTMGNRSKRQNKSLMDVISAPNQYYGFTAKNKDKRYGEVKDIADDIANQLVNGTLEDTTDGAEFFLLPDERTRKWHGDKTKTIGSHTFYKPSQ